MMAGVVFRRYQMPTVAGRGYKCIFLSHSWIYDVVRPVLRACDAEVNSQA